VLSIIFSIEGSNLPEHYSASRGAQYSMSFLNSVNWVKVAWAALIPFAIFVIIFGTAGVGYANMHNLPAFLPVSYAMVLAGFASIGLAIYKISRIRAKERVYARDYLGAQSKDTESGRTNQKCTGCNGTGQIIISRRVPCGSCSGKGYNVEKVGQWGYYSGSPSYHPSQWGYDEKRRHCYACYGRGSIDEPYWVTHLDCRGSGIRPA
jgi:hypothetical protein